MSEIVLNNKKLNRALRKKNKKTFKNVLSTSDKSYCPQIRGNHVKVVQDALERYLPRVSYEKIPVDYNDIKNLSKEERKAYRENLHKDLKTTCIKEDCLIFGINHVNRLLFDKKIEFVLIADDVIPKFMVDGTIQQCLFTETAVLIVPDLKDILKRKCGIKSMIAGIRTDLKEGTDIFYLNDILKEIYENYKAPMKISSDDTVKEKIPKEENLKVENILESFQPEDVYLTRESKSKRVFDSSSTTTTTQNSKKDNNSMDFLSFGDDISETVAKSNLYKPLVVKRIMSDPNRSKKKFKKFK